MNKELTILGKRIPSLAFCLIMDLLGMITYLLPLVGEWVDIVWAPISAFIFYTSFGGRTGRVGAFVNLIEELFPFTDAIPTFTLGWIYERAQKAKMSP